MEATGADFLPIDHRILWRPDPAQATPGMLHNLNLPAKRRLDPLDEAALVVCSISPDELEPRKTALERSKQPSAAVIIFPLPKS